MAGCVATGSESVLRPCFRHWPNGHDRSGYVGTVGTVTVEGEPGRWTVVVRGKLDEAAGAAVHRALRERMSRGEDPRQLLFDLRDVEDYDVLGRAELTSAHRLVVAGHRRCVYVSERSRIRGLALLAIREVQDANAQPVATLEQGQLWLAEGRLLDAEQGALEQGARLRPRS